MSRLTHRSTYHITDGVPGEWSETFMDGELVAAGGTPATEESQFLPNEATYRNAVAHYNAEQRTHFDQERNQRALDVRDAKVSEIVGALTPHLGAEAAQAVAGILAPNPEPGPLPADDHPEPPVPEPPTPDPAPPVNPEAPIEPGPPDDTPTPTPVPTKKAAARKVKP
jgi:hypothetical protein